MYERSIIRHQQQTCGVVIQSPNRLHIAQCELIRQDGQYTGVMAGLARALEIGGFVQCDIDMLAVRHNSSKIVNSRPSVSIGVFVSVITLPAILISPAAIN